MYELLSLEVLDKIPSSAQQLDDQRGHVEQQLLAAGSGMRDRYGDKLVDLVLKCVAINPLVSAK